MTTSITDEPVTYRDYTDTDTQFHGAAAPFEIWEGDHTALVHVLWSLRHDGLIAGRPDRSEPLRQALFDRLFGETRRPYSDGLIDDLRAILDAHDMRLHPHAPGAARLTREEIDALPPEPSPRQGGDSLDLAASVIRHSRWFAAAMHQQVERAKAKVVAGR